MRYFIEFWSGGECYFRFPTWGETSDAAGHAREVIAGYFVGGTNEPRPVPPNPNIPNEVRITDESGRVLGSCSLADEHRRRTKGE